MANDKPLNGLHTEYHDNGQKMIEENYKDGKPDGTTTDWYENGQKRLESNHKEGKSHGKSTFWNENGQIQWEDNHKDGKHDGTTTEWYENGQKKLEQDFKNGRQDGEMTNWDVDGDLIGHRTYKDDELVWSNNSDKNIDFNILALQGDAIAMTDEEVAETCETFPMELLHTPFMNLWLTWYHFLKNKEAEPDSSDEPFYGLSETFTRMRNFIPSEHWIEISKEYYPNLTNDWWMDEGKLMNACQFCYSKHSPDLL
jgi:hypothetical protein